MVAATVPAQAKCHRSSRDFARLRSTLRLRRAGKSPASAFAQLRGGASIDDLEGVSLRWTPLEVPADFTIDTHGSWMPVS
jgi:hypothetical protein